MATDPFIDFPNLATTNASGQPMPTRFKDPNGLRSLYVRQRDADLTRNREMAKWQALLDGKQPFDPALRLSSGQAYLANFNPMTAKAKQDKAVAAYTDMIEASAAFIEVQTTYGEPQERQQWSAIMSEQMSLCIRDWPAFLFRYAYIPHYMTWHGVGIAYFPDRLNWQWAQTCALATSRVRTRCGKG